MSQINRNYNTVFLTSIMENLTGSCLKKLKELRDELIAENPDDAQEIQKAYYTIKAELVGMK